jgi:hypothetical protein
MLPGSYFMRHFGNSWISSVGMRLVPGEMLRHWSIDAAVLLAWFLLGMAAAKAAGAIQTRLTLALAIFVAVLSFEACAGL